jgi:hypothetical protein
VHEGDGAAAATERVADRGGDEALGAELADRLDADTAALADVDADLLAQEAADALGFLTPRRPLDP